MRTNNMISMTDASLPSYTDGCCAYDRGEAGFGSACPSCKASNDAPDCSKPTSTGTCSMAVGHIGPCNWGN